MDSASDGQAWGDGNGLLIHEEKIVIVGAGIGGLACALALHRVSLKAVVLEQSDALRVAGSAISLWTNAFRVLDVLGIGEKFRTMYTNLLEWETFNNRGKHLAKVVFADCEGGPHELRAVERKVLLETLAGELPQGTIRFNSCVTGIKKSESRTGVTEVELQDGSIYSAKVVIGFDGTNSVVASWMGLEKAQPVGYVGIRGMAIFPDGHKFEDKAHYFVGKGVRTAYLPVNTTKVYWFLVWNDWSQGWRDVTPEQLKEEALKHSKSFEPPDIHLVMRNTPPENLTKTTIRHRLNTKPSESQVVGGVAVAGDASHPTTPNMGQGGCMALEDAIILTQKLHGALRSDDSDTEQEEHERIHRALLEFHRERHERTYSLTAQANSIGTIMQSGWSIVCFFRDWFLIPMAVRNTKFLSHTTFDVGELPTP